MQLCFLVTNTSEVHHTTQKQAETYILADYRPHSLPLQHKRPSAVGPLLNPPYFLREYFTSETGNRELAGWTVHRSIVDNADFVIFDFLLMSKSKKIAGEDADSR